MKVGVRGGSVGWVPVMVGYGVDVGRRVAVEVGGNSVVGTLVGVEVGASVAVGMAEGMIVGMFFGLPQAVRMAQTNSKTRSGFFITFSSRCKLQEDQSPYDERVAELVLEKGDELCHRFVCRQNPKPRPHDSTTTHSVFQPFALVNPDQFLQRLPAGSGVGARKKQFIGAHVTLC